jgi:hypothetical protein
MSRGVSPERFDQLVGLAKMRLLLADGTKGASHRDVLGTGQFVTPKVRAVTSLDMKKHLVLDHGIDPAYAGTLIGSSLQALHDRVRVDRDVTS